MTFGVRGPLGVRTGVSSADSLDFEQSAPTIPPQAVRFDVVRAERVISPIGGEAVHVREFSSTTEEATGWEVSTVKAWRQLDTTLDGRLVACGANGDRVYWSYGGVQWVPFNQCPLWNWQAVCVVKSGPVAGRIIAGSTDGGIWYSDTGATWTQALAGVQCRALTATADGAVYAGGTSGFGMRKSVDGGVTWTTVAAWTFGDIFQALGNDGGNVVYAANNGGQVRTTSNGGASFVSLGSTVDGWRGFLKTATTLYGATSSGLRTSADNGATWSTVKAGLPAGVNGLALRDGILFTAATSGTNVVWQTTDDGTTGRSDYQGASVTVSGGQLRFAEVGARRYRKFSDGPNVGGLGVAYDAIVADVVFSQAPVFVGSGTDASFDMAILGWHRDSANYLTCEVNNLTGSIFFRGALKGVTFASSASWYATTQTMRLAVTWDALAMSLWHYSTDGHWVPVASYRVPSLVNGAMGTVDPMQWSFDGWNRTIGAYCSVAASVLRYARVEIVPTGRVGLRDLNTVTYEDGQPIADADGRIYITATVAPANQLGSTLNAIHACHCGVFLYDPCRRTLSPEIGRIYTRHPSSSNGYLATRGNSPIKVVCDRTSGQWLLLVSDWSDGGRNVRIVRQKTSPLRCASVVDASEILVSSPDASTYCYDADLIYFGGLWRLVCTWGAVNGNNALVSAPTLDGLKTAAKKVIISAGEGPRWTRLSGVWYINVNGVIRDIDGNAISAFPRLELNLSVTGIGTPHLTVFPVRRGAGTVYVVVSFDGQPLNNVASSLTNGSFLVWESASVSGAETFR